MTKLEKLARIDFLKKQASVLKGEVDYYNALQHALKLVLNGSYFLPLIAIWGAKLRSIRVFLLHII